jgi:hypothetical protein
MPPGQQQLMDATQAAWQAMQSGAPEALRGGEPYGEAERTFRRTVEAMRVGNTPPDQAVSAAREAHAALGRLREAVAAQAAAAARERRALRRPRPAPTAEARSKNRPGAEGAAGRGGPPPAPRLGTRPAAGGRRRRAPHFPRRWGRDPGRY